jgi:hypothetical protein
LDFGEYSLNPSLLRRSFQAASIILAQVRFEWNEIAQLPDITLTTLPCADLPWSSFWS